MVDIKQFAEFCRASLYVPLPQDNIVLRNSSILGIKDYPWLIVVYRS